MTNNETLLSPDIHLRPAKLEDAEAVAALTLAVCSADGDPTVASTTEDILQFWKDPEFNLTTDSWVAESADGKIVGYEECYNRHAYARLEGDGYVHPDFEGRGIGTALLRAMEERARQVMKQAEPDLRVTVRNGMNVTDTRARELHQHEGYLPIRYSWRMEIRLEDPPTAPIWPEGIELRAFQPDEQARVVFDAVDEAFQDHWGHVPMRYETWLNWTLKREGFDPTLFLTAWDGDQIAGMSLCRYRSEIGWVGTLGVRRPWRKKGLGLALLNHSFGEFYRRGTKTIGLGVDAQNPTGATRLYQKAGMQIASEYVFYEKELRPGREIIEEE